MMLARVQLPWPPSATSPNASGQGKWRKKAGAAKGYKLACWALCEAEKIRPVDAVAVDVLVTFCPPSKRRYDLDNALARAKQGLDAVAEAIAVDDSHWRRITLERGEPCRDGAVIVHIMEAEA
ncbi:hypothetical protein [Paracoccus pantotrophus]|uniref:hypothetical protein n=1 Tax=Paracoccus pantotrophus TaxID=82367 RepID=UPI0004B2297A|nr:hypothetical protein [Paracoccus pantotrophus]